MAVQTHDNGDVEFSGIDAAISRRAITEQDKLLSPAATALLTLRTGGGVYEAGQAVMEAARRHNASTDPQHAA